MRKESTSHGLSGETSYDSFGVSSVVEKERERGRRQQQRRERRGGGDGAM